MPEWNEMQKAVIGFESGKGALLVTAAAGSGKTAVVVERVLSLITRKDDPRDISRLLVITFTNAAAEEMRSRIVEALRAAVEKDPGNRHLARQQKLIHAAEFTTIDSFFLGIVRENFNLIGISPDARIAGEEEIGDLRDQVLEELLEEKYAEASPDFLRMAELFSRGRRDDALCRMIEGAYRAFRSMPEPKLKLREAVSRYETAPERIGETLWGRVLIDQTRRVLQRYLTSYENLRAAFLPDPAGLEEHVTLLEEETAGIRRALDAEYDWTGLRAAFSEFAFPTFPSGKRKVPEEVKARRAAYKELRDRLKAEIKKQEKIYSADEETCRGILRELRPAALELEKLVNAFAERFLEKKTDRRVLEFDDVSQYAYGLLWRRTPGGDLVPTEEAVRLSERYDEVIVDEYQDTNSLQDEIFRAVTGNRRNLLMVGDVKQSIYGFRYAEPEGFVRKLEAYRPLEEGGEGDRKQALNRNYRSTDGVIDAVNRVFSRLMTKEWGGLVYDRDQYLYRGRPASESVPVEFYLLDKNGSADDRRLYEARAIARYVKALVQKGVRVPDKEGDRPMTYRDAAVLLRSGKGRLDLYENAFREEGVPVTAEGAVGLYSTPEGEFVLNLLSVVDNPYNDVALLTLLTSPAFSFSPEELAWVRAGLKKEPLIRALRVRRDAGDRKSGEFLEKLDRWRRERTEKRLGLLIRGIFDELSLSSLIAAGEDGEARLQNVYRIASLAETYESAGGLSAFLRGAALAVENGREPEGVSPSTGKDAVRVMTIHKSKGLQFPVVVVADTVSDLLMDRNREPVNFEKELGFGFKLHSPEKEIRYTTFVFEAVNAAKRRAETAEELRVLYVAMTRAMERLVFFAVSEDSGKLLRNVADLDRPEDHVSPFRCYAEWVLAASLDTGKVKNDLLTGSEPDLDGASDLLFTFRRELPEEEAAAGGQTEGSASGEEAEPLVLPDKLFEPYPFSYAAVLPTKITATEIKNHEVFRQKAFARSKELSDESTASEIQRHEIAEELENKRQPGSFAFRRPGFMTEKGLSAAEKGSAVHLALRLVDPGKASSPAEIARELDRLEAERYLSKAERKSVDEASIMSFYSSDLGKRMQRSKKIYRELKFTLTEDAGRISDEARGKGESLLLQGIVDAAFEEDGGLILLDYKTDWLSPGGDAREHLLESGYHRQLAVYAEALTRMTSLPVTERWIYFTRTGQAVRAEEDPA